MESTLWARLGQDKACELRRGAWYRVVRVKPGGVVIAVGQDEKTVPRQFVELVTARPRRWSVIERGQGSFSLLAKWGKHYIVCPSCRRRQAPTNRPQSMRCLGCNELFDIAWDEPFVVGVQH